MHLDGEAHAPLLAVARQQPPVRDGDLVPLVVEDLLGLRGPGRRHPVGGAVPGRARGQARHEDDRADTHELGEVDGAVHQLVDPAADDRVQLVAVDVEGAHAQPALADRAEAAVALARVAEHSGQVEVGRARPAAGGQLDGGEAEPGGGVEHPLEGQVREGVRDDADLHGPAVQRPLARTSSSAGTLTRRPPSFMERTRASATTVVRRASSAVAASSGRRPWRAASTQAESSAR